MFAISSAITVASTAASMVGQSQMASAQKAYNRKTADAARQAYKDNIATLQLQRTQEREAASAVLENAGREALQARATQRAAAGEAGVSGLSVDALTRDFMARELNFATNTKTNFQNKSEQIDREMVGARAGAISQINQANAPVNRPNYLEAGLRTGAGVFNSYDRYLDPLKINQPQPRVSNAGMAALANRGSKW
ncbi:virion core protein, T7 gp14 family [Azospirillum soli]|uniref:virion core protein, T7 gp14 family n=1 Tax=Azospirillum soli TaxID=1304799 RepID=UPI001AE61772|nr:hypothetical protein [Azospirillum soli]MBP2312990.1 murein L,D-transpeptidase YcbB/YkuD [Azospirillum soli]